ncbi:MAG: S1/P1 nuclease [Pseudomonadota bacterium]
MSIACGLLLMCASFLAHPWGPEGHRVVRDIATAYLTPAAKQQIGRLLQADLLADGQPSHRSTLGEVASWPDEIRPYSWSKPFWTLHYDNITVRGASTPSEYCADGKCLSVQLEGQIKILSDATATDLKRNQARVIVFVV